MIFNCFSNSRQFHKSFQKTVKLAAPVFQTEMCDNYNLPLFPGERSGMGTRSAINQYQGKLYRNMCMQIITLSSWDDDREDSYEFADRDYSQLMESDLYKMLEEDE